MEQNTAPTDYRALSASALLDILEHAGQLPDLELLQVCLERRTELTPTLLEWLARPDDPELSDDDPRSMDRIHAGLLLCAYREPAALPIFDRLYREYDVLEEGFSEWFDAALASYGPAIMPVMSGLLSDPNLSEFSRSDALITLATIAVRHPELRPSVVEQLRAVLPPLDPDTGEPQVSPEEREDPPLLWTWAMQGLADLRDLQSQEHILALFRSELIEEMMIGGEQDYLRHLNRSQSSNRLWLMLEPFDLLELYEEQHQYVVREAEQRQRQEDQRNTPVKILGAEEIAKRANTAFLPPPATQGTVVRSQPKIGRNEHCPCGSGRKYKHCHGK